MRALKLMEKKPLWMHILLGGVIIVILLLLFMLSLRWLTRHGATLTVPGVTGKSFDDAKKLLEEQGFEVEIQDSVYNDTAKALAVLRQFPEAESNVKVNRTVYLTINRAIAPTIEMPLLEGLSFRNAEVVLKQYGLKRGDTFYKSDFARNAVLEQVYNGDRIKPGTKIRMGSEIDLILGSGLGQTEFPVPDLFGLTYVEAKMVLQQNNLVLSSVLPETPDTELSDTLNAFVVRQRPERFTIDRRYNRIRQGQLVDLWLSPTKPVRQVDTTSAVPGSEY